jgi:hypothetical protein
MRKHALLVLAALLLSIPAPPAHAAVASSSSYQDFTANGATVAFSFTFPATSSSWVETLVGGVKQTSGVTVALNANQTTSPGGTVAFTVAPANGAAVRIQRTVPLTQELVLQPYSAFPAKTIEKTLDRLVMQGQQEVRERLAQRASDLATQTARDAGQDATWLAGIAALNGTSHAATDASSVLAFGSTTPRTLTARFADRLEVKDNGLTGDGSADERVALQALIDRAPAGSTIHFTTGVYEFASFNPSAAGVRHSNVIQISKSNLTFECDAGAVLRLKSGAFTNSNFNFFSNFDAYDAANFGTYSGITFRGCEFDVQGASNPEGTQRIRVVLQLGDTSNATVEGCTFRRMNVSNVVAVGFSGRFASGARIVGNRFFDPTDGDAANVDHSSVYVNASDSVVIGNTFINTTIAGRGAATACELHASNNQFVGNTIKGYRQAVYNAAFLSEWATPIVSQVVAKNTATDLNASFQTFWINEGATMDGVAIEGNTVSVAPTAASPFDTSASFVRTTTNSGTLKNVSIRNNIASASAGLYTNKAAIRTFKSLDGFEVIGNSFVGWESSVSLLAASTPVTQARINVSDNTFTECGDGDTVIYIDGGGTSTVSGVTISRNRFFNATPQARPIYVSSGVSGAHYRIGGNEAMNFTPGTALVTLAGSTPTDVDLGKRLETIKETAVAGGTVSLDASRSDHFYLPVTAVTPFTVAAPANGRAGQSLTLRFRNSAGAALGAITWDAVFKKAYFPPPAPGFTRTITFIFDGANWTETGRTPGALVGQLDWTVGTVPAGSRVTANVTIPGVVNTAVGAVSVSPTGIMPGALSVYGIATATDTVAVVVVNATATPIDAGALSFNVAVNYVTGVP